MHFEDYAVLEPPFSRDPTVSLHRASPTPFIQYQLGFNDIVGPEPRLRLIAEYDWPWAHEAGIYHPALNSLFVTSNRLISKADTTSESDTGTQDIIVSQVVLTDPPTVNFLKREQHGLRMANGGTAYKDGMLFCDQGYGKEVPSALVHVTPDVAGKGSYTSVPLLNNFHGRAFNSLNDVVIHRDGSIWFTDPNYGAEQGFKPAPELPNQIYRFNPVTKDLRVVADGIPKCNGLVFSPDHETCYIADTAFVSGTGVIDPTKGGWIYAYDVIVRSGGTFLANKRVFAFTDCGAPDGIKVDTDGNVYAGCFDGVHIWDPAGSLLGKIVLPNGDGCANLCFGESGKLYIMAENRLYEAVIAAQGALKGVAAE